MKIALTPRQLSELTDFVQRFEDCEQLSATEYVLDLYDLEPPISLDFAIVKDGIDIDGAAELKYHDEMDGWYVDTRIEQPELILRALENAGALTQ